MIAKKGKQMWQNKEAGESKDLFCEGREMAWVCSREAFYALLLALRREEGVRYPGSGILREEPGAFKKVQTPGILLIMDLEGMGRANRSQERVKGYIRLGTV